MNGDGEVAATHESRPRPDQPVRTTSKVGFNQVLGQLMDSLLPRGLFGTILKDLGKRL
jgi:hypothetical protein